MLVKKDTNKRDLIEIAVLEELVPLNHAVRQIDATINLDYIYDSVKN